MKLYKIANTTYRFDGAIGALVKNQQKSLFDDDLIDNDSSNSPKPMSASSSSAMKEWKNKTPEQLKQEAKQDPHGVHPSLKTQKVHSILSTTPKTIKDKLHHLSLRELLRNEAERKSEYHNKQRNKAIDEAGSWAKMEEAHKELKIPFPDEYAKKSNDAMEGENRHRKLSSFWSDHLENNPHFNAIQDDIAQNVDFEGFFRKMSEHPNAEEWESEDYDKLSNDAALHKQGTDLEKHYYDLARKDSDNSFDHKSDALHYRNMKRQHKSLNHYFAEKAADAHFSLNYGN